MTNEEIKINIYDEKGEIVKEATAHTLDLRAGTIRKLMQLLKIESMTDTAGLFMIVIDAWDEITAIMNECFPDVTEKDWDGVKVKELLPVIIRIMKYSFTEMMTIPADKKNA